MNLQLNTKTLAAALSELSPIVARKTAILVLDYIKCVVKGNRMRLEATDSATTIRKYIDIDSTDGDGAFLVRGVDFANYVGTLSGDVCNLSVEKDLLTISAGKSKAKFPSLDAKNFPEVVMPEEYTEVTLPTTALLTAIKAGKNFVAPLKELLRPVMWNIRAYVSGENLKYAATDTRKLIVDTIATGQANPDAEWSIEQNAFAQIEKLCQQNELVRVKISEKLTIYQTEQTIVYTSATNGKFPDVDRVIPKNNNIVSEMAVSDLLMAIKRVSPFATSHNLLKIHFAGMETTVSTANIEEGKEAMDAFFATTNGDLTMGFHSLNLQSCLAAISSSDVRFELNSSSLPAMLKDAENPNRIIVLMPMHIQ